MKYLIVNGDDFGASSGVNCGIIEAHRRGVLTSTSLLIDRPWSENAATLSRTAPRLSVGLHVDLSDRTSKTEAHEDDYRLAELRRQFSRFVELLGKPPTHLDSHHNVHRDPQLLPHFREFAQQHDLSLREQSPIRYFTKFYGQWAGESHPEQIGVASLQRMLISEIHDGMTELSCHPGLVDETFSSGYAVERQIELRTLCDPAIPRLLTEQSIQLINYREAASLLAVIAK